MDEPQISLLSFLTMEWNVCETDGQLYKSSSFCVNICMLHVCMIFSLSFDSSLFFSFTDIIPSIDMDWERDREKANEWVKGREREREREREGRQTTFLTRVWSVINTKGGGKNEENWHDDHYIKFDQDCFKVLVNVYFLFNFLFFFFFTVSLLISYKCLDRKEKNTLLSIPDINNVLIYWIFSESGVNERFLMIQHVLCVCNLLLINRIGQWKRIPASLSPLHLYSK
jgi:hypothetical protein